MEKVYNYKDIKIFKFKVTNWDELEDKTDIDTGLVAGLSMGDAVDRIESIYTSPKGECSIIDLNIYELESFNHGIVIEDIIKDEFKDETLA